ncbi:MAG: LLM class flavin-dependent oxidoreductase, partial [Proteobacteria bacterium]|nr:LLM class flavin-dependent oxidoreductase [Pseudomonadota bacterium]
KAGNGKSFDDFEIQAGIGVIITDDVKAGIDSFKPGIALYAGGMGHKNKNFHKDRMIKFGYADAAEKIQELYLSGRKDEAAAAVPDEYVDEQNLIGSTDRIRQNWAAWADSGCTGLNISTKQDEVVELMAELADTRGQMADAS